MKIKGKRVLKNGVLAGYVRQKDGTWKWRFLKGPTKKKGGEIMEGRLKRFQSTNTNKSNATLRNKLGNLSKSLKQKHLASPKVFGKHDNIVYNEMYEKLDDLLKSGKSNKNIVKEFLTNGIKRRMKNSIEKWTVKKKNCKTRRCKKQSVASELIEKDLKKIDELLSKQNKLSKSKLYEKTKSKKQRVASELINKDLNKIDELLSKQNKQSKSKLNKEKKSIYPENWDDYQIYSRQLRFTHFSKNYQPDIEKICNFFKDWVWISEGKNINKNINEIEKKFVNIMLNYPGISKFLYIINGFLYNVTKKIEDEQIELLIIKMTRDKSFLEYTTLRPSIYMKERNQYPKSNNSNNKSNNWKINIKGTLMDLNELQKIGVNIMLKNKNILELNYNLNNFKFKIYRYNDKKFLYTTYNKSNPNKEKETYEISKINNKRNNRRQKINISDNFIKKMVLALNNLYIKNTNRYPRLSNECYNIVQRTLPSMNEQKVIVYSESTPIETVRAHLSHRVPTYFGGNLFKDEIDENIYKKLINGNDIDTNNKILEKIELANKLLNYTVIGEMIINKPKPNVNYHAVHAFGVNFEKPTTVDYKLIYKEGNTFFDYTEKVNHLYENIFKGVEYFNKKYRNNEEYSIIIPAIGMGAFLTSVPSEYKEEFIRINITALLNIIVDNNINKSKKVYIRFRDQPKVVLDVLLKQNTYKKINDKINLESNDLFDTNVMEKNQYYVNAWDTRSFIGNKLITDPTIDGWFVAGYRFNQNLINDSYLHNKVIFNSDKAEIVNN